MFILEDLSSDSPHGVGVRINASNLGGKGGVCHSRSQVVGIEVHASARLTFKILSKKINF